jgi:Sec-independent protein translocase protein TatA
MLIIIIIIIIIIMQSKARDARRISATVMKYMRRTAGCTGTDYETSTHIAEELKITPILDKLLEYY